MHSFDSLSASEIAEKLLQALRQPEGAELAPEKADQMVQMAAALYEKTVVARHEAHKQASAPPPAVTEPVAAAKQINLLDVIEAMESNAEPEPASHQAPIVDEEPTDDIQPEMEPEPEIEPQPEIEIEPEVMMDTAVAAPAAASAPPPEVQAVPSPPSQAAAAPKPGPAPAAGPASINDKLSSVMPKRSLADKLALTPLADIKKAISLNLKFQFINELFGGDAVAFEAAIFKLNTAPDAKTAMHVLEHELLSARGWDVESKVFLDLHTLVERRYL